MPELTEVDPEAPPDASTPAPADGDAPACGSGPISAAKRFLTGLVRSETAREFGLIAVIVIFIAVVARTMQLGGHDWGDDFALYMRQAKALNIGNIGEVIADNRFSVDNSGWHTFSPYAYPWGWPLLVAPLYALFGLNYGVFKLLEIAAFCTFLLLFFAITKPRVGARAATLLTLLIGLSFDYVGATNTVLSDIPYLGFVGLSLWWLDRCRVRGILSINRRDLVILGLLLAYTYNIRREGAALLLSLASLHFAVVAPAVVRERSLRFLRECDWRQIFLPYITFALSVVVFHLLLPTVLLAPAGGVGLQNVSSRIAGYKDILAQQIGLKPLGEPIQLFHNEVLGRYVLLLLVLLAVVGLVTRLLCAFREDLAIAAYLCGSSLILLLLPFQDNRYLFTITPFLVYFAYHAILYTPEGTRSRSPVAHQLLSLAPVVCLAGLVLLNAQILDHAFDYYRQPGYVLDGPESPEAREMFAAVEDRTRSDAVILFFRSRAMTLYTDRQSIMGADLNDVLQRADWYVMKKDSTYSQKLLSDAEASTYGLTKTWENPGWVMWRIPRPLAAETG
ncbi:MAG: hypothetical protein ACR2G7_10365 [Acidimicrobiales bacterium]